MVVGLLALLSPGVAVADEETPDEAARPPRASASTPLPRPTSVVVLVTLDTTRADDAAPGTGLAPRLAELAGRGTRWTDALSAAPLTLPAHAGLLTGRPAPLHGLRENATTALPTSIPTLAESFARAGWRTAAVVGSRILDRRFGLARGFDVYDDVMSAHVLGEYGEPERRADAVVDRALELLALPDPAPFFLWVHVYDAHRPYAAPGSSGGPARRRYREEIAFADSELGRLFDALVPDALVAVVADHGESFGEHGEEGHGTLLSDAVLRVPLVLVGPGVPEGVVRSETVGTPRLARSLAELAGVEPPDGALPPLRLEGPPESVRPILSETRLPWRVYGWSPLQALTEGRWRLRLGPGATLHDRLSDPEETEDRTADSDRVLRRLTTAWREGTAASVDAGGLVVDPELARSIAALGYVVAGGGPAGREAPHLPAEGYVDPREALPGLERLREAKERLERGDAPGAGALLEPLVRTQPENLPIVAAWTRARAALGDLDGAWRGAARLLELEPRNPGYVLLGAEIARARGSLGEAEDLWEATLALDPRQAAAWLGLAEVAARAGDPAKERALLEEGIAARAESAPLYLRVGQLAREAGQIDRATAALRDAVRLLPDWPLARIELARLEAERGDPRAARAQLEEALALRPPPHEAARAKELLGRLPEVSQPEDGGTSP